jgi:hypothetical protein
MIPQAGDQVNRREGFFYPMSACQRAQDRPLVGAPDERLAKDRHPSGLAAPRRHLAATAEALKKRPECVDNSGH